VAGAAGAAAELSRLVPLVLEMAERAAVAAMLGEADERVDALRRVLLSEEEATYND